MEHLNALNSSQQGLPEDPVSRADVQHVLEHGFVILENVFTKAEANEAVAELQRLSGEAPKSGRNTFEGFSTNRVYALLNKTRIFDKFCILPRVLSLNDYFLDPGYNISALQTIRINPGERAQELHHDDGYCNVKRPRAPLGAGIIVALDDITAKNGATRVVPGSHTWDSVRQPEAGEAIPMAFPAGSVLYFLATTWHGGGPNDSEGPRYSATVQYCQPYVCHTSCEVMVAALLTKGNKIRPIENQTLAVDPRRLDEIPERIVEMMGYRTHPPFIGYADGLGPRKAAQRMVKWLQSPMERDPPGFARSSDSKL